jgi:glycosyltransferase involved in cell wall biosynthesis
MKQSKTSISIVLPAYNEEAIILDNVRVIAEHMHTLETKYDWEILIINDGSKDKTGELADSLAKENKKIRVYHHFVNKNLGHALRTGFTNAKGEYIVVLDLDLSYSVEHIERLTETIIQECADVVIASPYMKGGKVTAVPFLRAFLSKVVNRFMRMAAQEKFYTFTGMVRAYRTEFIRTINLKTKDYEINPEILYKSMILRARIIEIPAHLDWSEQNKVKETRSSSIKVIKGVFSGLMSGFIFRPYIFFLGVGFITFLVSMYIIGWIFYHTISVIPQLNIDVNFIDDRFSYALAKVFRDRPHAFFVGGFTFVIAIQFLSLGFMSLQSKRYFEELFHLGSSSNTNTKNSD